MPRKSYVILKVNDEWTSVPKEEAYLHRPDTDAPYVIPDIQPYRSTITGEVIGSRSTHRSHLKQHGCIEIGNEKWPKRKRTPMPDLVPDLRHAIREVRNRGR